MRRVFIFDVQIMKRFKIKNILKNKTSVKTQVVTFMFDNIPILLTNET